MKCKTYQAVGRSPSQDIASLKHLDHEGATATGEVVGGADSGINTIHDGEQRGFGGDEGTDLGEDQDERGLAQISGFATHVGAGDDQHPPLAVEFEVVGDEGVTADLLHHRWRP